MLRQRIITLVASAISLFIGGCGSIMNVADSEHFGRVYGGVLIDGALIAKDARTVAAPASNPEGEIPFGLGFAAIADLPLSAVVDTLTLPITVPILFKWLSTDERERKDSAPHFIASPGGANKLSEEQGLSPPSDPPG